MTRKRHKPGEIVAKLRQVDVLMAQGTPMADAVRSIGVIEVASGRAAGQGRDEEREPEPSPIMRRPPAPSWACSASPPAWIGSDANGA